MCFHSSLYPNLLLWRLYEYLWIYLQKLSPQAQVSGLLYVLELTILASECIGRPDGEMEPLLLMGGPGIPGMLGTMDTGLASYT